MNPFLLNKTAVMALLLSAALPAWALSSDPDQPMNIEADQADIDEERGVTVYSGSVVMNQGSIRIRADKVSIYNGEEGFDKAVLEGKPARFRQRPDGASEYVRASAKRIEYMAPKNLLILMERAEVTQGEQYFSGNRISYDTRKNQVKARKAKSGKERVKITIGPRKKKKDGSGKK